METTHHPDRKAWTKRPHFAPRQQLSAHQLNGIAEDELRRQRLMARALYGSGVVFGYKLQRKGAAAGTHTQDETARYAAGQALKPEDKGELDVDAHHRIHIACGLILDRHGRELYWPGGWFAAHDIVGVPPKKDAEYLLQAHYAQRRAPPDGCGPCPNDTAQWIEQSVVFTLTLGCKDNVQNCPPADCVTLTNYVCGRTDGADGAIAPADDLAWACREPGKLDPSPCGEWYYDAEAGIPIACVHVQNIIPAGAPCGPRYGFRPDPPKVCSVRPFVYRNPLLFELIRGCHVDLARVEKLSWSKWLVPEWTKIIRWEEFVDRFRSAKDNFDISFTKPIAIRTLHPASIILNSIIRNEDMTNFGWVRRIPIRVLPLEDVGGFTRGVRLVPTKKWFDAEIDDGASLQQGGAQIELIIHGQMLRDRCGRMLDARPVDVDPEWSGQSRPGGDFIATFRVAPGEKQKNDDDDADGFRPFEAPAVQPQPVKE